MTNILAIDPAETTGLVAAEYSPLTPLAILGKWEIEGGRRGLATWLDEHQIDIDEFVSEKFSPRPRPGVFKLVELEPLRIEGMLEDRYEGRIAWQPPGAMNIAGNDHGSTAANRKAANEMLKVNGLWSMPKEFPEHGDADDVNAAMKHLLARMRRIGHQPTLSAVFHV